MKIEELKKELEEGPVTYEGVCHDCGNPVEVSVIINEKDEIVINGGSVYQIKQGAEKLFFFKCDACFAEDHTLRKWNRCEVYTRVVGYLRPVNQYNIGKQEEYKMRKEFVNTKGL